MLYVKSLLHSGFAQVQIKVALLLSRLMNLNFILSTRNCRQDGPGSCTRDPYHCRRTVADHQWPTQILYFSASDQLSGQFYRNCLQTHLKKNCCSVVHQALFYVCQGQFQHTCCLYHPLYVPGHFLNCPTTATCKLVLLSSLFVLCHQFSITSYCQKWNLLYCQLVTTEK